MDWEIDLTFIAGHTINFIIDLSIALNIYMLKE